MERPVTPLEHLGGRVAAALEGNTGAREQAIDAARDQFLAGAMQPKRRPKRRLRAMAAAAAVLVMVAAGWLTFNRWTKPIQFTVDDEAGSARTWLAAPRARALAVRFSDGTRLRIDPSSRARVVDIDRHGARIALETGVIHADVIHTSTSVWHLIAGPFTIRVTGTRFDVEWDSVAEQFSVAVREGSVAVSGSFVGAERAVLAGESLRVSVPQGRVDWIEGASGEIEPLDATTTSSRGAPPEPPAASASTETAAAVPALGGTMASRSAAVASTSAPVSSGKERPASWRLLARRGDLRGAFAAADAVGFAAQCAGANAAELLVLGDAARLSGQSDRAVEALVALRQRYPQDARRAAAAFALGKVAFDLKRAYREASEWFATCLLEQPDGPLAREAAGRRIESLRNAGDAVAAKQAARDYLYRYPEGPHAAVARSLR